MRTWKHEVVLFSHGRLRKYIRYMGIECTNDADMVQTTQTWKHEVIPSSHGSGLTSQTTSLQPCLGPPFPRQQRQVTISCNTYCWLQSTHADPNQELHDCANDYHILHDLIKTKMWCFLFQKLLSHYLEQQEGCVHLSTVWSRHSNNCLPNSPSQTTVRVRAQCGPAIATIVCQTLPPKLLYEQWREWLWIHKTEIFFEALKFRECLLKLQTS